MTLRHLKVFICVCKNNSITKAAEELFVAQPAVSNTIAEIEKHYKIVLFNRISQRLSLTEEGKNLLIKAQEVISAFDEFEAQAQNASFSPVIRIGSSLTIGKEHIPNLIKSLKDEFLDINVQVSINQTAVIEEKILEGNLDFAFTQAKPSSQNLNSKIVSSHKLIAVCGNEYKIPQQLTLKELCNYELLLREDGSVSREFLSHSLALHNISVSPVIESVSNQALISAATENLGVTILPETMLKSRLKKGRLKEIIICDCELTRNSFLIYHKNKTFSPFKKEVFDFCYKNYNKI